MRKLCINMLCMVQSVRGRKHMPSSWLCIKRGSYVRILLLVRLHLNQPLSHEELRERFRCYKEFRVFKSSKCKDHLLKVILLQDWDLTCPELAQECVCMLSKAKTSGGLVSRCTTKKPLLSKRKINLGFTGLDWSKKYIN